MFDREKERKELLEKISKSNEWWYFIKSSHIIVAPEADDIVGELCKDRRSLKAQAVFNYMGIKREELKEFFYDDDVKVKVGIDGFWTKRSYGEFDQKFSQLSKKLSKKIHVIARDKESQIDNKEVGIYS